MFHVKHSDLLKQIIYPALIADPEFTSHENDFAVWFQVKYFTAPSSIII